MAVPGEERPDVGGQVSGPQTEGTTSEEEEDEGENVEPSFFSDPKRLIQTGVIVVLLIAGIYLLLPSIVGLDDAVKRLQRADWIWIAVALAFNVLAFGSYVALFRGVVGENVAQAHLERELPDHDGGAGGDAPVLGRRRRRDRPDLLGASQGRDAAPPERLPDGRLPGPPLRGLHADRDHQRHPAADRGVQRAQPGRAHDRPRRDRRRRDRALPADRAAPRGLRAAHALLLQGLSPQPAGPAPRVGPRLDGERGADGDRLRPQPVARRPGRSRGRSASGRRTSGSCGPASTPSTSRSPWAWWSRASSWGWSPT